MKHYCIIACFAAAAALTMTACRTASTAQNDGKTTATTKTTRAANAAAVAKVAANTKTSPYATAKMTVDIKIDGKEVTLGGRLYMKRDDVIRLQLNFAGLMEVGRIEFTSDDVLVMDRINKQYIRMPYSKVDFLKMSGLSFSSLQALFWNELFVPGHDKVEPDQYSMFTVDNTGSATALSLDNDKLAYRWTAGKTDGLITRFAASYTDTPANAVSVTWDYAQFKAFAGTKMPTSNCLKVNAPKKTLTLDMTLSSLNTDSDWETRTQVTSKYKQANIDDILKKLQSM